MAVYIVLAAARLPLPAPLEWLTGEQELTLRRLGPVLAVIWAVIVAGSRVHLGVHTLPQILAGFVFGGLFAICGFMAYIYGLDKVGMQLEEAWVTMV